MKSSFLIYHEYKEPLNLLTDEQRGKLLMALIDYSESGTVPELDGISMMAFSFIQRQMDRDSEKYENRCNSNRENGKKGGRPKKEEKPDGLEKNPKNPSVSEKPNGFLENPKNPIKNKDKDKDKEKDINNNIMCKADVDALFERLWKAYPNKRGKGQVSEAKKRKLAEIGEEYVLRAMTRYIEDLKQDEWRKPQNGSTFFNSGYIDYLDENYEKPAENKKNSANFKQRTYDYGAIEERFIRKINGTDQG